MPRAKRRAFVRSGINLHNARPPDYTSALCIEIIGAIAPALDCKAEARRAVKLRQSVIGIAEWLDFHLRERQRPTDTDKRKALNDLRSAAQACLKILDTLDSDSRDLLERAADNERDKSGRDVRYPEDLPPVVDPRDGARVHVARGRNRVAATQERLSKLVDWARTAAAPLKSGVPGAKYGDVERDVVAALLRLWEEHHPHKIGIDGRRVRDLPTRAQLRSLAHLALAPVYARYGMTPKLDAVCAEILAEARSEN